MSYSPLKPIVFLVCLFVYAPVLSEVVTSSPTVSARSGSSNPNQERQIRQQQQQVAPPEQVEAAAAGDATDTVDIGNGGEGPYQQATAAQGKSNMTSMIGMGIAMVALPQCSPTHNPYACVLGAAGIAVSMIGNQKANQAQNLRNQLHGGDGGANDATAIETASVNSQIDSGLGTLNDAGFNVGEGGIIETPDGSTIDVNNLSTASLQNAGLSPAQAEQFMDDFGSQMAAGKAKLAGNGNNEKKSTDEDSMSLSSADGPGGAVVIGGRGKRRGRGYGEDDESGLDDDGMKLASADRDPASFDKFSVKHGKDKIGVGYSDLFRKVEVFMRNDKIINGLPQ